jgi:hypothetical protein
MACSLPDAIAQYQRIEKALGKRLLKQIEALCCVPGFEADDIIEAKKDTGMLSAEQQEQVATDAMALVCEYLSNSTAQSFMSSLGLNKTELEKKQAAPPKRSKWEDTDSSVDEHRKYMMKSAEQEAMQAKKVRQ